MKRALIIGLGGAGQRHLRNLLELVPGIGIGAVRRLNRNFEIGNDLTADTATDIMEKYGVTALQSLDEAVEFGPDLAIVANPSAHHAEYCAAMIEAGIPVFIEKPATTTRDDFDRLASLADRHGVTVMVGFQLRWNPCFERLKVLIEEQRIGRIQSVEISVHSHMPSWHGYEKPGEFYAGVKEMGGGVVLTEIHEIDLMCWLFGRPSAVFATGGRIGTENIDVEDTVCAAMEIEHDGQCFPAALSMSFVQAPPARRFAVNGASGKILVKLPQMTLTVTDASGSEIERLECPDFDRNLLFVNELSEFLTCIETGAEPSTSLERVRDGHYTAFAIKESLDSRQAVTP